MIIKPKYFWPGLIIGLLLLNVSWSVSAIFFATSDGGPQVVPDYYEQAANYDDEYDARQASLATGWAVEVEFDDGDSAVLRVTDRSGAPVEGLGGTVTFFRPHLAEAVATAEVSASDAPGSYRFASAVDTPGVWDLEVNLSDDELTFEDRIRKRVDI